MTAPRKPVEIISVRAIEGAAEEIVHTPNRPPPPWGWVLGTNPHDGTHHIYPTWDIDQHWLDADCRCGPVLDKDEQFIHTSFDGRERYERDRSLLN